MLTGLAQQARHLKFLANQNSTTILTGMGVLGVGATAYFTGRATFKAAHLIEAVENLDDQENPNGSIEVKVLSKVEKAKLVWRYYIAPVGVGLATITAIILAHRISAKKIAALTLAAGVSERTLKEYKEKVLEKFGERKEQDVRDEIAQDRVTNNPPREVIAVGTNEVLCYDMFTGRYFTSTAEEIKRAENKINYELLHFGSASLSEFFNEFDLPPTTLSDTHGWNTNHLLEVDISTTKTPDDRPCLAIDFKNPPMADYNREPYA